MKEPQGCEKEETSNCSVVVKVFIVACSDD